MLTISKFYCASHELMRSWFPFFISAVNTSSGMTVYPWESLVPLFGSSPPLTPPLLSPPLSAPPVPDTPSQEEEDDDVFETVREPPAVPDSSGSVGKRRTQSLSALQSNKEPQSPLKACF